MIQVRSSNSCSHDLDPRVLRDAFGMFPTGVVAVAAHVDGTLVGMAMSSFTSVSLDPPLVSFSVARSSKTWPVLRRSANLGVTILAEDHGDLSRQLAGPVEDRFEGVAVHISNGGAVTLDEGIAQFDCTIYEEVEAGDHIIVLLELHGLATHTGQPLVFHRSNFGRLA
jgi:flavin reductase (DIM6/NTAB) family NADH-FMN oxidoreductase RutF